MIIAGAPSRTFIPTNLQRSTRDEAYPHGRYTLPLIFTAQAHGAAKAATDKVETPESWPGDWLPLEQNGCVMPQRALID